MGQAASHLSEKQSKRKYKVRRELLIKSLKKLTKHGAYKRKKLKDNGRNKPPSAISALFPLANADSVRKNVILPTLDLAETCKGRQCRFSKHSLISYALSKLAILRFSDSKLPLKSTIQKEKKFSFHGHKPEPAPKPASSKKLDSNDCKPLSPEPEPPAPIQIENLFTRLDINNNEEIIVDISNSKVLREEVVKKILSTKSIQTVRTPEELYRKNLDKFETLLAITATSAASEEDADSVDENNNIKQPSKLLLKNPRIISTSKNRIEVDAKFLEWIENKRSANSTKKESSSSGSGDDESLSLSDESGELPPSKGTSKNTSAKPSTIASRSQARSNNSTKVSTAVRPTNHSKVRSNGASSNTGYTSNYYDKTNACVKRGSCGGKGALCGAPPAYLDYGGAQTFPGAACRKGRDPVIERLKNVDVVEQLTYMVPTDPCCDECNEGCEEDECDYYAMCESCGEMEPLPEELKNKLKGKKCKKADTTPVTYSRRQRFNFKNKEEEDDDGPPFRYDGTQGKSCRCPCCVAGLRRNPNCGCKCCQVMGNSRRVNSFDEIPVGKNPQIRRLLCPMEEYEKKLEVSDIVLPGVSGLYKFDVCGEYPFERQVPRTPTPIILEVPAPRRMNTGEIMDIATGLRNAREADEDLCCCCDHIETCEPEPEPIYLPPVYGQYNPCCPPCCTPQDMMNNNCCGNNNNYTGNAPPRDINGSGGSYYREPYGYSGTGTGYKKSSYPQQMSMSSSGDTSGSVATGAKGGSDESSSLPSVSGSS